MSTYGSHPEQMTVKLTVGDGTHLVATSANGWAGPVSLVWGPDDGEWDESTTTLTDVGTVVGTEVSWTLTVEQVTARAAFPYVRLVDNGMTMQAGEVIPWTGGLGSTVTQTIASLTAGPPGPPGPPGGVELVTSTVTLDETGSPVREFYCTAATTINGVAFDADTAVVFRRTSADVWGYIIVEPWTDLSATTTTTTTEATTTTTTTAATTTTTTTEATTTTTTTAATTTTTTTEATTTTTTTAATTTTTTTAAGTIFDNFERTTSVSEIGGGWTVSPFAWGITSGEAYCDSGTADRFAYQEAGSSNHSVEATRGSYRRGTTSLDRFAVVAKLSDVSNYYMLSMERTPTEPTGTLYLWKRVGGTYTVIASDAAAPALAEGDTMCLTVNGSAISGDINGVTLLSVTNSDVPAGTLAGMRWGGAGAFGYEDITITPL